MGFESVRQFEENACNVLAGQRGAFYPNCTLKSVGGQLKLLFKLDETNSAIGNSK